MAYVLQLIDNTGLSSGEFSIFVMGFSYKSELVLNSVTGNVGEFRHQSSGTVSSFLVGSESTQIGSIHLDETKEFLGGRLYFFIAPAGSSAPAVEYSKQPKNPPNRSFPPYAIVEFAYPANAKATLDVQTVDGFPFPLTLTLNGERSAGMEFGQPPDVSRDEILEAYRHFMTKTEGGAHYLDTGFIDDVQGILNPGAFLTAVDERNAFLNLESPLHNVFNADLKKLFGATSLKIHGVNSNGVGSTIPAQDYTVTPLPDVLYPGTDVHLPALECKGTATGTIFHIFNPVGISVLTDDNGKAITGTILHKELTLNSTVSALEKGMFINGAGLKPLNDKAVTRIDSIKVSEGKTIIGFTDDLNDPAQNSQYNFSRLSSLTMFQTPGQMVFANSGVFADIELQLPNDAGAQSVLGNLQNQIVSALNRGVAVIDTALEGETSKVWGTQTQWYPQGTTQNLFSLFMHCGVTSSGKQIFLLPKDHTSNARNQPMAAAYGFAFDENAGPVPPAPERQPQVPSKFDQNVPVGATVQITLGPWHKCFGSA